VAALALQDREVSPAADSAAVREAVAQVVVHPPLPEDAVEHLQDGALADPLEADPGREAEVEAPEAAQVADQAAVAAVTRAEAGPAEQEAAEAATRRRRGARGRISAREEALAAPRRLGRAPRAGQALATRTSTVAGLAVCRLGTSA